MTDRRDWREVLLDRIVSGLLGALLAAIIGMMVTGDKLHSLDLRLARIETVVCSNFTCNK